MPATAVAGPRVSSRDRREQYLAVAADIVARDGVAMVTMEAVAAGAGVNKALLYRQFDNRGALLLALYDRETAEIDRRVEAAIEAESEFDAKVRAWVHAWFCYVAERGALLGRLMEARTVAPEVATHHRERRRRFERRHGDWYAEELGLPREVGRDAAAILFGGLGGVIDRWTAAPSAATRRRLEETYAELLLGGIRRLSQQRPRRAGSSRP